MIPRLLPGQIKTDLDEFEVFQDEFGRFWTGKWVNVQFCNLFNLLDLDIFYWRCRGLKMGRGRGVTVTRLRLKASAFDKARA